MAAHDHELSILHTNNLLLDDTSLHGIKAFQTRSMGIREQKTSLREYAFLDYIHMLPVNLCNCLRLSIRILLNYELSSLRRGSSSQDALSIA